MERREGKKRKEEARTHGTERTKKENNLKSQEDQVRQHEGGILLQGHCANASESCHETQKWQERTRGEN